MIAPSPVRQAIRPAARRPITPVRWLGRAWRELRKMRTAIILLAILALLAVIGTLLPQLPQNPRGVMGYVLRHPANNHRVQVSSGLLAEPAAQLLREFFLERRR